LDRQKLTEACPHTGVEAGPFEVLGARHPAKHAFHRAGATLTPVDDPFQHTHVLAITGPEELALLVSAKPVYAKDTRRVREAAAGFQPVLEIVAHVIAAKRQHGEWIAAHLADFARGRSSGLRSHGRGAIYAIGPVGRLVYQWNSIAAPAAKDEGRDRHAL